MATLVEMATEMVIARAKSSPLTADEMMAELNRFHAALKKLEAGEEIQIEEEVQPATTNITLKEAFKKNEVVCMVCGKGGFKTLGRHISASHGLKPREYKKQFGIPASQTLAAKSYSESRRKMANDMGLINNLAKGREAKKANIEAMKAKPAAKAKATPKAKPATKAKPVAEAKP